MNWAIGDTILGKYRVDDIFTGGMGLVYRVHHLEWKLDLAMKCPKPEYLVDAAAMLAFEQEIETWANLGLHSHIVTCYYSRRIEGDTFVFSEFVTGGSLRDWIASRKLYQGEEIASIARIIKIAAEFAWGMDYAHGKGLVHQDIKPGNVLLSDAGTTKVTDFGLARYLPRALSKGLVNVAGYTRPYASPEQLTELVVSPATDVWSWAVTILEMFMGGIFWEYGTAAPAAFEHYQSKGRRMPGCPVMPAPIAGLIKQCLQRDPSARPASFDKIAAFLLQSYKTLLGDDAGLVKPDTEVLAADSLNNRAVSLLEVGRATEARQLLERALERLPDHPETKHNLQLLLKLQRQHGAAKVPYLLARPKSGAEHHHESERFNRLISKATNALQLGDANEAQRYLQMAKDIEGVASHPKLRELVDRLG